MRLVLDFNKKITPITSYILSVIIMGKLFLYFTPFLFKYTAVIISPIFAGIIVIKSPDKNIRKLSLLFKSMLDFLIESPI